MLVLSRKANQRIVLGNGITLLVVEIRGDTVRLGIEAPKDVVILREELVPQMDDSGRMVCSSPSNMCPCTMDAGHGSR